MQRLLVFETSKTLLYRICQAGFTTSDTYDPKIQIDVIERKRDNQ